MKPAAARLLVADDEDALRESLVEALALAWPSATVVAQAADGAQAWDAWLEHQPDACFLDIRMPGMSGLEVAQRIDGRTPVCFVTAYGDRALAAFDAGAVDYVVKPVQAERLERAAQRLNDRLAARMTAAAAPPPPLDAAVQAQAQTLRDILARLGPLSPPRPALTTLWAGVGREVRAIPVAEVLYFEADTRYTRIVYRQAGRQLDALLKLPLKELLVQLDPQQFLQVHRSTIVAAAQVAAALRVDDNTLHLRLRDSPDTLVVSRPFQGLFKPQ